MDGSTSVALLGAYHREGDEGALVALIDRHRGWLWSYVRRHMGATHRAFEESEDVVQDVLLKLFRKGPAFLPADDECFRRLVATIVLNRIRDRHEWARAERRDPARKAGAEALEVTRLAPSARSQDRPPVALERVEEEAHVHLALELIPPDDAEVIRMRQYEELEFARIGESLGIATDAARMRFNRAVQRLGEMVIRLQQGRYHELAPDLPVAG